MTPIANGSGGSGALRCDALVFFGASGDLAYKQIFPALAALVKRGVLDVPIIGVARAGWTVQQFVERARRSLEDHRMLDEASFGRFGSLLRFVDGDYGDMATFARLSEELGAETRPLHYLAIEPELFETVVTALQTSAATDGRVRDYEAFGCGLRVTRFDPRQVLRLSMLPDLRSDHDTQQTHQLPRQRCGDTARCTGRRGEACVSDASAAQHLPDEHKDGRAPPPRGHAARGVRPRRPPHRHASRGSGDHWASVPGDCPASGVLPLGPSGSRVDIAGLSYAEAARVLGVPEATITTRLYRARQQVARELDPERSGAPRSKGTPKVLRSSSRRRDSASTGTTGSINTTITTRVLSAHARWTGRDEYLEHHHQARRTCVSETLTRPDATTKGTWI